MRRHPLRAFARGNRASAGVELAIGAAGLLAVAALCIDLYARVEADTGAARAAAAMADYVSRGPDTDDGTLDGSALQALGQFLHTHELHTNADVVFVVSAMRQGAGTPPPAVEVLWSDDRRDVPGLDRPIRGATVVRIIGPFVVPRKGNAMKLGSGRVSDRLVAGSLSLEGGYPMTMNSVT